MSISSQITGNTASFDDIDVPVDATVDAAGNGTAIRETGFGLSFEGVAVDSLNTMAIADDAAFVSEALAGNIYFNIHTNDFGGGEIRGQLDTVVSDTTVDGVRTIVLSGGLDAAQEPDNASDSAATGTSSVTIVVDADGNATYSIDLDVDGIATSDLLPVAGFSAIHLHNAPAGVNGPVILDVVQDAGGDITGANLDGNIFDETAEGFGIDFENAAVDSLNIDAIADDAEFVSEALAGNIYFNVHTNDFPGGEIRGQLDTIVSDTTVDGIRTIILSASLDAAQEPDNASDSDATGTGAVTIVVDAEGNATYSVDLDIDGITTSDLLPVAGFSAIHLHNAPAGVNGPVILDVIQDAGGDITGAGGTVFDEVIEAIAFSGVENITGSNDADTLTATGNAANTLIGNDGNDFIAGGGGADTLDGGAGDDTLQGGGGSDSIDGSEGSDTISFADIGVDVEVTLGADGSGSAEYIVNGNTIVDTFAGIENVLGSENDDRIIANGAAPNTINGGAGNDFIAGGGATDILDGGEGVDTNSFINIGVGVTASLADGTAVYSPNADVTINETFTNFENLDGTNVDDSLTGDSAANTLTGNDGNDFLAGGGGADTLLGGDGADTLQGGGGSDSIDGGEGSDTISFADIGVDVEVTLGADGSGSAEYIVNGNTIVDTFAGIENVLGSENDDRIIANGAAPNTINGGAGNDFIAGGGATDILDGGEGFDTNSFINIGVGVTASLADGTAVYSPNANVTINETFANFEGLDGTNVDDSLTGDSAANTLTGNDGNDVLFGLGGADTLLGGDGDDILAGGGGTDVIDGGAGNDTNSFEGINFGVTANLANGRAVYVTPNGVVSERFTNIENLTGTDLNDILSGDRDDNVLIGNDGNDLLRGRGGEDTIDGGDGNDRIFAGSGDDVVTAGNGADFIIAGSGDDIVTAGDGNDDVRGFLGDDTLDGGAGNDRLFGNSGSDEIQGGEGSDTIFGGFGSDIIDGGAGNDSLIGGLGDDTFIFTDEAGDNTIRDFGRFGSNDTLDLDAFDIANFDALLDLSAQDGNDVVITLDSDTSITLENVSLGSLSANDFILG